MKTICAAILGLSLISANGYAQEHKFLPTDISGKDKSISYIDMQYMSSKIGNGDTKIDAGRANIGLRYGFSKDFDIGITVPIAVGYTNGYLSHYKTDEIKAGMGDIKVALNKQFFSEDPIDPEERDSFALLGGIEVAVESGTSDFSSKQFVGGGRLAISKKLGKHMTPYVSAEIMVPTKKQNSSSMSLSWAGTLGTDIYLTKNWWLLLEGKYSQHSADIFDYGYIYGQELKTIGGKIGLIVKVINKLYINPYAGYEFSQSKTPVDYKNWTSGIKVQGTF